jgi:hypothetical protein
MPSLRGRARSIDEMETMFPLAGHSKVLETIMVAHSLGDAKQSSGWCLLRANE